jgi:hypothetical protein
MENILSRIHIVPMPKISIQVRKTENAISAKVMLFVTCLIKKKIINADNPAAKAEGSRIAKELSPKSSILNVLSQ